MKSGVCDKRHPAGLHCPSKIGVGGELNEDVAASVAIEFRDPLSHNAWWACIKEDSVQFAKCDIHDEFQYILYVR